MNPNLILHLGEEILTDAGIPFDEIVRLDLNLEGDRGYGPMTPGHSEYPVLVRYVRDGADLRYRKTFSSLCEIIRLLEDIDEDIRDSW